MLVSLIFTFNCPACGTPNDGAMVRTVRINKHSMRTVPGDIGLGLIPRDCKPCGAPLGETVDRTRLTDDDLVRVNEYRARKGWSPIGAGRSAQEVMPT